MSVEERFWAKVLKPIGLDGCWEWTGAKWRAGYGMLLRDGRLDGAHRVSWAIHFGPIPEGLWVLHHCDNASCVRPDHLFLGSARDNSRDAMAKGRWATGARHGMYQRPERRSMGERNGMTTLDADAVRLIRRLAAEGQSMRSLAPRFHVSPSTVENIVHRRTWGHL